MNSIKKYVAEFIGTAILVIFGCGAAVVSQCAPATVGHLIAGGALAALCYNFLASSKENKAE